MGYPVVLPVGPQRGHEEVEWKTYLNPRGTGRGIAGKKQSQKRVLTGKLLLQATVGSFSGRMEGLILLPILQKKILIHFYKK